MSHPPIEILLATRNPGKLREMREILSDLPLKLLAVADLPDAPEVVEDGETFEENALGKARLLAGWWGGFAVADDSGLEVDALGGAPGVRSARYAGPGATDQENIEKLLRDMRDVPMVRRAARFRCVMALAHPDGRHWVTEGACHGLILRGMRGTGGFGYDPVFFSPEHRMTFAEMEPEMKNRISHRARALRGLRDVIERILHQEEALQTGCPE